MLIPSVYGQNTDTINSVQKDQKEHTISPEETKSNLFFEKYNISTHENKSARAISSSFIRENKEQNSEIISSVSAGEVFTLLKIFPKESVWAIKHKDIYGFVPVSSVMQIKNERINNLFDTPPRLTSEISIDYPKSAYEKGIEGKVILELFISKKGKVKEVKIIRGVEELNKAAIKLVKKLRFEPALHKEEEVDTWITFPINFTL